MAKKRVYEVAKELGVPTRDVLARAQSLGLEITTALSSFDANELSTVLHSFEDQPELSPDQTTSADIGQAAEPDTGPAELYLVVRPIHELQRIPETSTVPPTDTTVEAPPTARGETDQSRDIGAAFALVALLSIIASIILRISVDTGLIAYGVVFAFAIAIVVSGEDLPETGGFRAGAWVFGSMALVPTIPLAMATIQTVPDWAFPVTFAVPVAFGAAWILNALPDWRVAGMKILDWDGLVSTFVALPFVVAAALSGFDDSDVLLGTSDAGIEPRRLLVLVLAALVIIVLFYGLIQGFVEPLIGRATVPWISVMFATTFAASWLGLAFLLALGLVIGKMRTTSGSIWPGFIATAVIAMALAIL